MRRILITIGLAAAIAAGSVTPANAIGGRSGCPDGGPPPGELCDMAWTGGPAPVGD